MAGCERRGVAAGDCRVEVPDQFGNAGVVAPRDQAPRQAGERSRAHLPRFDHRIGRFLERAGAGVPGTGHAGADEVGGQRPTPARDGERRPHGPGAEAHAEIAANVVRPQHGVQLGRLRDDCGNVDRCRVGCRPLERGDQGGQGVRENVEQLRRQGARARPLGTQPDRMEGEAAVDLHDGPELGEPPHQGHVRRVPDLLVPGADQEALLAGDLEQFTGLALALDERLLDEDVGAGVERGAGRLEVGARRRAHMHQMGARLPQEVGERGVRRGACQSGELSRSTFLRIAHGDDGVRCAYTQEGLQM